MELIRFGNYHNVEYCSNCGASQVCDECGCIPRDYCAGCGESLGAIEAFIILSTGKYHGADRSASHVASLIIAGKEIASAYVDCDESDTGGDVAWLQLSYISANNQTKQYADIIADFAKWVRFTWVNPDKISELPTLERLLGFITHKDSFPYQLEKYIALQDATKINVNHLLWDFTSREN